MLRIQYSPMALKDLQDIDAYIKVNWGEEISKQILKKITTDIRRLELYPESGVSLANMIHVPTEYRYMYTQKNYVFYYLESETVRIVRVLNEQQDYLLQLFGTNLESIENNQKD